MNSILIIDDDPLITEPAAEFLQEYGYVVTVANDGEAGLTLALQHDYDLIILDILMPKLDGWSVCREIRKVKYTPILMLTALGDEVDKIMGLELGADDYLTKPFSSRVLLARLRALLRRVQFDQQSSTAASHFIEIGDIRFDPVTRQVWRKGVLLEFRHKEIDLLALLINKAGYAVGRPEIFDKVWGTNWLGDMRTLDVHIRWLRKKLEDNPSKPRYLKTVFGIGYRFVTAEELEKAK